MYTTTTQYNPGSFTWIKF